MSHKKDVLSEVAGVVGQLAVLKFDQIGSLTADGIGPKFNRDFDLHSGPFDTFEDELYGMIEASPSVSCCDECKHYCENARIEVKKFFETSNPALHFCKAPFSLQHGDFSAGNLLFEEKSPGLAPVLTGLIDFDGSCTSPIYYIYENSGLQILDDCLKPEYYADNKILRKHFVRALANRFPPGSRHRKMVHRRFQFKSYFLDRFHKIFPGPTKDHDNRRTQMKLFLENIHEGTGRPRGNVLDWSPDSDSELNDEAGDESNSDGDAAGQLESGDDNAAGVDKEG